MSFSVCVSLVDIHKFHDLQEFWVLSYGVIQSTVVTFWHWVA